MKKDPAEGLTFLAGAAGLARSNGPEAEGGPLIGRQSRIWFLDRSFHSLRDRFAEGPLASSLREKRKVYFLQPAT